MLEDPTLPTFSDTSLEIERKMQELTMALTPGERVMMVCQSFTFAQRIVLASLPPGLDEIEIKRALCERFYGDEVDVEAFVADLKRKAGRTE